MAKNTQRFVFNHMPEDTESKSKPKDDLLVIPSRLTTTTLTQVAISENVSQLGARTQRQAEAIRAFRADFPHHSFEPLHADATSSALGTMFNEPFDWSYRCYEVDPFGELFQRYLYLFNVIIAFEWEPSRADLAVMERTAQRASDFLFDVTDGWMGFGQVVIGGSELLNCADIQVLASNRLHPRAWVGGLHETSKYIPIRIGRGLWQKNDQTSIPWDEPEGYRTLIHEWAHYALELIDAYLETHYVYISSDVDTAQDPYAARRSNRTMIVSSISQPVESIMARLEGTSELVPKRGDDGKQKEWQTLTEGYLNYGPRFPRITAEHKPLEGPLPLRELPHVITLTSGSTSPSSDDVLLFDIPPVIKQEHCWVYLLKYNADGSLERIVAQGTLDAHWRNGFRLLQATAGDQLVLIGDTSGYAPVSVRGSIKETQKTQSAIQEAIVVWETHNPASQHFPLIDVLPEELTDPRSPTAKIRIHVFANHDGELVLDKTPDISIVPLDQITSNAQKMPNAIPARVDEPTSSFISLDGHLLIEWKDTGRVAIASFSQGGGPPTGSPTNGGAPLTAGSSDGNLMVFFDDRADPALKKEGNSKIRLITTRQPGIAPELAKSALPNAEPRGYAFSLGSNGPLPMLYTPTLALAFDKNTDLSDGEAVLHRLDDTGTWQPLPSYRPDGAWYVATPLTEETAPRLVAPFLPKTEARVERYRIFMVASKH